MRDVGLFFGSFNPVHVGHLIIANHVLHQSQLHEIWFVVSPQNPFKTQANLLDEYQRLHLLNLAIADHDQFRAIDIEFKLPKPSYTGTTLAYLEEKYPQYNFHLIMGEDNLKSLHKWRNVGDWIKGRKILVYPRADQSKNLEVNPDIEKWCQLEYCDAPILKVSASYVRQCIKSGFYPKYIVPETSLEYIEEMNFYTE